MTWEQKFAAIKAIDHDASLHMRAPGDWFVSCSVEVGGDGMLAGTYGNGKDPERAVDDHWEKWTRLPNDKYLVVNATRKDRRHFRWNGFMWAEVPRDINIDARGGIEERV